jgi:hypothetical protein
MKRRSSRILKTVIMLSGFLAFFITGCSQGPKVPEKPLKNQKVSESQIIEMAVFSDSNAGWYKIKDMFR